MTRSNYSVKEFNAFIFVCLLMLNELSVVIGTFFVPFENKVRVDIKWPGDNPDFAPSEDEGEVLVMTTVDAEKYKCIIPHIRSPDDPEENVKYYKGPSPSELLKPIFSQLICYFRIDSYWSYELCHGYYLRQFHSETTIHGQVTQEFYLGKFDPATLKSKESSMDLNSSELFGDLPTVRVEGLDLPYWSLNMTEGTFCGVSGKTRFTNVLYVCHPKGNNAMYSFRESSSCEYEVIVLTTVLCKHPAFKIPYFQESVVNCYPLDGAPTEPQRLQKLKDTVSEESKASLVSPVEDEDKDAENLNYLMDIVTGKQAYPHDPKLVEDVLKGEYCLHGGSSWWRYEFCYGKHIHQYHEEPGNPRTTILLGTWNKEKHLAWLKDHPTKKPKEGDKPNQLHHLYSGGSLCEETSQPRQVEVRLKCKEDKAHPDSVTLFLLEPKVCQYILSVESPIFCPLMDRVDQNGLTSNL